MQLLKYLPLLNLMYSKSYCAFIDLIRTMKRHGIVASFPSGHPVQSLKAMRLLSATDFDGHTRVQLTHQLYKSYWVDNKDITDSHFLQSVVADIGWHVDVDEVTGKQSVKDELRRNTDEALKHGAFGVPRLINRIVMIGWMLAIICLCSVFY